MIDVNIFGVSAVAITGIMAEVVKRAGVPTKYIPAVSLLVAILVVCFGTWSITVEGIITGIVIGAITSGVYSNISKGTEIATELVR